MQKKLRTKLSQALEIPKEVIFDVPLISLTGSEEINIENHKGIAEYSDEKIRLKTGSGILKVEGKKLILKQITKEAVEITGYIKLLEFTK